MAHILVRNSLNNTIAVKLNTTFTKMYVKDSNDGDPRWLLEVATTYPSASGTIIAPKIINNLDETTNINEIIENAVADIASQIDWNPMVVDDSKPFISSVIPDSGSTASIESNVYMDIKDNFPSAGVDMSSVVITLNNGVIDFDITNECEIEGDPFHYTVKWMPGIREYSTYNEE